MSLLEGKVAIVTGGSRGIGKAIVDAFAAEGAAVAFTYLSSREKAEAMLSRWAAANELKGVVDIEEGLENAPAALIRMFEGRSRGKLCVRISP